MELTINPAGPLTGTVSVPGDKSISHRAVMLGALAAGDTRIENFLPGADCLSTVRCFQDMGVGFSGPDANGTLTVHGRGTGALQEPVTVLDAGNSGTTTRLLLGILAGLPFFTVLTGDASLRRRPMARVTGPLRQMGAVIDGRHGGELAPLAIRGGHLQGIHYTLPVASAQVKSALLLAGLFAAGETVVTEPVRTRDHTERMLQHFGVQLFVSRETAAAGTTVRIAGGQKLTARPVPVPGDISSAAFLMVAASVVPGSDITITNVGVNPTRDGIIEALQRMGADITLFNQRSAAGEPVADIRVRSAALHGVTIGGELIPRLIDEVPVLAVAGALAAGETVIRDAAELKVKESNRIATMAAELGKMGAAIKELPDGLIVQGGQPLRGAVLASHGDHRVAMACAVAALAAEGTTTVDNAGCVDVSFPGFTGILASLGVK